MEWEPISESSLWDLINAAEGRMTPPQARLWEVIRVLPHKWTEKSYGERNGFWIVAIIGATVIWYNDIEEGFNRSRYTTFGVLDEYWCNQDELEHTLQQILALIETGEETGSRCGPPIAVEFKESNSI